MEVWIGATEVSTILQVVFRGLMQVSDTIEVSKALQQVFLEVYGGWDWCYRGVNIAANGLPGAYASFG